MVPFYRLARGKEKKVVFDELSSPGLRMPFANERHSMGRLWISYLPTYHGTCCSDEFSELIRGHSMSLKVILREAGVVSPLRWMLEIPRRGKRLARPQ